MPNESWSGVRLAPVPGVEEAATSYTVPGIPSEFQVELKLEEGRAESEPKLIAQARSVGPSYFATMRIPLLAGELCRDELKVSAAMVNRAFANTYFGGGSPIGRHVSLPGSAYTPTSEVRGIVGDAREAGLDREPVPTLRDALKMNLDLARSQGHTDRG